MRKDFIKHILKCIISFIGKPTHFITNHIQGSSIVITAIATGFMAFTSWQSVGIGKNVAKMTLDSTNITERLAKQDLKRLQVELRPYLIIKLHPGENEFLRKDGNSQQFLICYKNSFLILPFRIKNVGKLPAINIKAKYDSPIQKDVFFELGENTVSPDTETSEIFRPWVNITSIVNNDEKKAFEIFLKIAYMGNGEIDSRIYYSLLKLTVIKRDKDIYDIKGSDFKFGNENGDVLKRDTLWIKGTS